MRCHSPTPPLESGSTYFANETMAMWKAFVAGSLRLLMVSVGSAFALLYIAGTIIMHPRTALKKKKRDIPPSCLQDTSLGSHQYVTANGIKFHYVSAGDNSKPLMLLLHGFPEFWFSWRYQLKAFSKDYHVVAIDMRGYGDTDKPPNKLDYRIELLVQDIAELIPALGHSSCVLCAHDWGGGVAWFVAMKYPELVDRLIIMNCPHFKVFQQNLQRNCGQLCKSWYMFLFQVPKVPEFLFSMSDYSAIQNTFTGAQQGVRNRASFPPEVVEAYKYTFSQPGALTAPINYYRCLREAREDMKPYLNRKINMPTLIIWGDCDKFLSCEMADQHDMVCSDLTVKHLSNCSHWVQQDDPDQCNQIMSDFLSEKA